MLGVAMNAPSSDSQPAPAPVAGSSAAEITPAARAAAISEIASALVNNLPQITALAGVATASYGPGHKPGWKTTEFWFCVLVLAGNVWGACSNLVKPETAALISGVLTATYTIARSLVKSSAASPVTQSLAAGSIPAAPLLSSKSNGAQGDPATGSLSPFETKTPEGFQVQLGNQNVGGTSAQ